MEPEEWTGVATFDTDEGVKELNEKVEQIRVISEEILLDPDQAIRVQALDMSVRSVAPAGNLGNIDTYTQEFITRAEMFEQYIREGVIHNA